MRKPSHKKLCFLLLLHAPMEEYIPVYDFIGEKNLCGRWEWLSHKGTARISDVYLDMLPNVRRPEDYIIERKEVKGKSGTEYYVYRINPLKRNFGTLKKEIPSYYMETLMYFRNNRKKQHDEDKS